METLYEKMYNEIVIAGKLIVKMNESMEGNTNISDEFKIQIEETIDFLRNCARYYQAEYQHEVRFRIELEKMYQEDMCTNCNENDHHPCEIYACESCPHYDLCHEYPGKKE